MRIVARNLVIIFFPKEIPGPSKKLGIKFGKIMFTDKMKLLTGIKFEKGVKLGSMLYNGTFQGF